MLTSVAFEVCQVRVDDWPLAIVSGLAVSVAVVAAGGGGGGGGGGTGFLWHAPRNRIAPSANTSATHRNVNCFIFLSCASRALGHAVHSGRVEFPPFQRYQEHQSQ